MSWKPPQVIDGATVEMYASTAETQATGATRHSWIADPAMEVSYLVLARYGSESDTYLFYCDESWQVLSDTMHPTVDEAIEQANFEFTGVQFVPLKSIE
ncbi:hypothetical protein F0L68_29230 [Solihabitans fulvus]|uniref:Uncharacterized protein n=1 Tax=Solihabitans fulvus TaxID=1892852 RepID=A0A5B2WY76_9PSEU|nr:hypothetical protein [Solihabitans fulvus]KAA2254867.1 hypothetical protein F0L68_29230 [Solihabitans fulvus]